MKSSGKVRKASSSTEAALDEQRATERRMLVAAAVGLAALGVLVYSNTLANPFVFDDHVAITANPVVRGEAPLSTVLRDQRGVGVLTFAVNYSFGGLHERGYHIVNIAIHVLTGLAFFGWLRHSLLLAQEDGDDARGYAAFWIALSIAAIWIVHPLTTQAVTYVVQRFESLMSLFFVLMFYCFTRGVRSERPHAWHIAAIVFCALGMRTKEVMITAPVALLWFDRAVVASSWKEIWLKRRVFHIALALVWAVLMGPALAKTAMGVLPQFAATDAGVANQTAPADTGPWAVQVEGVSPIDYARTQPRVILRYLRLAFLPTDLTFDYGWPVSRSLAEAAPSIAAIALLLAGAAWLVVRKPFWGFWAALFFLLLAPTSTVLPIRDLAAEHRMYLPLAAVLTLAVLAARRLGLWFVQHGVIGRKTATVVYAVATTLIVASFALLTIERNVDYVSEEQLWRDTLAKRPQNSRAYVNLSALLIQVGEFDEAIELLQRGARVADENADVHGNLGAALLAKGDAQAAADAFREAIRIRPRDPILYVRLAAALLQLDDRAGVEASLKQAVELDPENEELRQMLNEMRKADAPKPRS